MFHYYISITIMNGAAPLKCVKHSSNPPNVMSKTLIFRMIGFFKTLLFIGVRRGRRGGGDRDKSPLAHKNTKFAQKKERKAGYKIIAGEDIHPIGIP